MNPRERGTGNREPGTIRALLVAWALVVPLLCADTAQAAVSPSQVLVLYNAEWIDDAPLTDPGQDSKEIAEHYVAMHTDPQTGEKPYSLGLRCVHGKRHLNGTHLTEDSTDNDAGVILRRGGRVLGSAGQSRDGRAVEFALPKGDWKFGTLRLELRPGRGEAVRVVEAGKAVLPGVQVQERGEWSVRLNGRAAVVGPFAAQAVCEDAAGKEHRWEAEYQDVLDVECSRTGVDGVRDDQNYVDDLEKPVKAFLDDPKNARPDGTLLKDHVLFLVVCYGLPKTAAATYGIARGVTDRLPDHGADIDLGQRLQLLYYDVEGALGFTPRTHRFEGGEGFTKYLFRAPQARPLWGAAANPFVHPLAYGADKGDLDKLPEALAFTPENRAKQPGRHLIFAMRVDGVTPLEARGMIDRAAYASRSAGPLMGRLEGRRLEMDADRVGEVDRRAVGKWLWGKGYRDLWCGTSNRKVGLFRLASGQGFFNRSEVYLPGGIAGTVESHQGWNRPESEFYGQLAQGVTVAAAAARVYHGAPHIHDKSWWDDAVLYPLLLKGKTVGEALLANQLHLEWITAFVGDPLYRLPTEPRRDHDAPVFDPVRSIRVEVHRGSEGARAAWLQVDLGGTPGRPEVAQLRATDPNGRIALCETFEGRPWAMLGPPEASCSRPWRVETVDPYGKRFSTTVDVACDGRSTR